MAGKVTYLHGQHLSSIGEFVKPVNITDFDKLEIEVSLGRALTTAEKSAIEENLELSRCLRGEYTNDPVTSQDIKRTLTGIGKLSGEKAKAAYTDLDSKSEPLILKALYDLDPRDETLLDPPGDLISKAALHALGSLPPAMSGAPTKDYQRRLADYVLNCWQTLGGKEDDKAHAQDNSTMSPLARFGVALFSSVEKDKVDATGVAKLLRAAKKRRASTR